METRTPRLDLIGPVRPNLDRPPTLSGPYASHPARNAENVGVLLFLGHVADGRREHGESLKDGDSPRQDSGDLFFISFSTRSPRAACPDFMGRPAILWAGGLYRQSRDNTCINIQ